RIRASSSGETACNRVDRAASPGDARPGSESLAFTMVPSCAVWPHGECRPAGISRQHHGGHATALARYAGAKVARLPAAILAEKARLARARQAYNSLKWQSICRNELEERHGTQDTGRDPECR